MEYFNDVVSVNLRVKISGVSNRFFGRQSSISVETRLADNMTSLYMRIGTKRQRCKKCDKIDIRSPSIKVCYQTFFI